MPDHSTLELVAVSPDNYDAALALSVFPDQTDLVASVRDSLADAYVYSDAVFRLAVHDRNTVGYVLLFPSDTDRGRAVNIVRLMIDHRYQRRGLGRKLLSTTLDWIGRLEPTAAVVRISTLPRNRVALALYESAGFVQSGMEDGEVALYLELPTPRNRQ